MTAGLGLKSERCDEALACQASGSGLKYIQKITWWTAAARGSGGSRVGGAGSLISCDCSRNFWERIRPHEPDAMARMTASARLTDSYRHDRTGWRAAVWAELSPVRGHKPATNPRLCCCSTSWSGRASTRPSAMRRALFPMAASASGAAIKQGYLRIDINRNARQHLHIPAIE